MALYTTLNLLSTLLALSTTTLAQTGTLSGVAPPIGTAPFPFYNGTLPFGGPTGTPRGGNPASIVPGGPGFGSGPSEAGTTCAAPVTVTSTFQATVTVTVPAGGSEAASTASAGGAPTGPYFSMPGGGNGGGPVGTDTGIGGTAASTGFAQPTGYGAYQKRYEMRGLKEEKKERRGQFWG